MDFSRDKHGQRNLSHFLYPLTNPRLYTNIFKVTNLKGRGNKKKKDQHSCSIFTLQPHTITLPSLPHNKIYIKKSLTQHPLTQHPPIHTPRRRSYSLCNLHVNNKSNKAVADHTSEGEASPLFVTENQLE